MLKVQKNVLSQETMDNQLMHRLGFTIQSLSMLFFSMDPGDRFLPVAELSEQFSIARGTIQTALAYIQESGAVDLVHRGHVGTFIQQLDRSKLLALMDRNSIAGVMPLPYSKRYEGFATGLYISLQKIGFEVFLAFMRGSSNRIKGLKNKRFDFVVLSGLSAEKIVSEDHSLEILCTFGEKTYVGSHILVVSDDWEKNTGKKKIGIDYTSNDQLTLTKRYFAGQDVEYVSFIYSQLLSAVRTGKIDAAVWNSDDIGIQSNGLRYKDLELAVTDGNDTEAAVICRSDDSITKTVFKKILHKEDVVLQQQQVMHGDMLPEY
jgi:hypothetical protein